MRVDGNEILEKDDDTRSQRRAEQSSAPAQGDHEQHLHRCCQLKVHWAHEAVVVCPQDSGKPAEATGDDEPDVLVQPHVVAEGPHARLTLPDSHQGLAEWRANDDAKNPEGDEKSCERKIVKRNRMSKRPW